MPPERGVFESDAADGQRAFVVIAHGRRVLRIELPASDVDDELLIFLAQFLAKRDGRQLRLLP